MCKQLSYSSAATVATATDMETFQLSLSRYADHPCERSRESITILLLFGIFSSIIVMIAE
jgi:hypothetical protein